MLIGFGALGLSGEWGGSWVGARKKEESSPDATGRGRKYNERQLKGSFALRGERGGEPLEAGSVEERIHRRLTSCMSFGSTIPPTVSDDHRGITGTWKVRTQGKELLSEYVLKDGLRGDCMEGVRRREGDLPLPS